MDIIVKEAPEYKDVYDEQLKEYTRNYNDKYKIWRTNVLMIN